jgi:hypothetical protein
MFLRFTTHRLVSRRVLPLARIVASACLFLGSAALAQDKLIFAVDVIRHGERTPVNEIPTVPHQWAEGFGQLTATGIQQEHELGIKLRGLYVEQHQLLPSNYVAGTVYARSTDVDRTLMSAQALLMGLYPPGTGPRLADGGKPALPGGAQPVPLHTIPTTLDGLLIPDYDSGKFGQLVTRFVLTAPEWKQKTAQLEPKFAQWSRLTGVVITNLFPLMSLGDTLEICQRHQVPLPPGLQGEAAAIIDAGKWTGAQLYRPAQVGHATGNVLLREIANLCRAASAGETSLKFVLFSAHETTLLSAMSSLEAPLASPPPYASDLRFALFRTAQNGLRIEIKFNDKPVALPGASGDSYTLAQFEVFARRGM